MPDNHASDYISQLEEMIVTFARHIDEHAASRGGVSMLLSDLSDEEVLEDLFAWHSGVKARCVEPNELKQSASP